jgi:hypothetical protein
MPFQTARSVSDDYGPPSSCIACTALRIRGVANLSRLRQLLLLQDETLDGLRLGKSGGVVFIHHDYLHDLCSVLANAAAAGRVRKRSHQWWARSSGTGSGPEGGHTAWGGHGLVVLGAEN